MPLKFPPVEACDRADGCLLIRGHRPPCKFEGREKAEANPERDGDPKLAAARERGNLAFQKRNRAGPNYIPHNRRV
jgi:hypothetical protein